MAVFFLRPLFFALVSFEAVCSIDNGLGLTPPMGWRSWNYFGRFIDQDIMLSQIDALVSRSLFVDDVPTSLWDLGYTNIGLDDTWQACGTGYNGSFHDQDGNPLINGTRFPSMLEMVEYGHSKNVSMGWYLNNCVCKELNQSQYMLNWEGDVNSLSLLGFDAVKIDSCGDEKNTTLWAEMINATGRPILIENCRNGNPPSYIPNEPLVPSLLDCPFNYYRISPDIHPNFTSSIIFNLQFVIPYQNKSNLLSRPGCWAYPDMLEVGLFNTSLAYVESRTHFGAWCIVSSPLILGFDLTNAETMAQVWDIISNKEAIAVNQAWAGEPGHLVNQSLAFNGSIVWQVWAKQFNESSVAAFVLNADMLYHDVFLDFTSLGLVLNDSQGIYARDIWQHEDLGCYSGSGLLISDIAPHDSVFLLLTVGCN